MEVQPKNSSPFVGNEKNILIAVAALLLVGGVVAAVVIIRNSGDTEPAVDSTQPPGTQPPTTQPPGTEPPTTQPPGTEPPTTQPPGTEPPTTQPPGTEPPTTQPPGTEPPTTQPPGTEPPTTQPPGTEPPSTQPPGTEPPKGPGTSSGESGVTNLPGKATVLALSLLLACLSIVFLVYGIRAGDVSADQLVQALVFFVNAVVQVYLFIQERQDSSKDWILIGTGIAGIVLGFVSYFLISIASSSRRIPRVKFTNPGEKNLTENAIENTIKEQVIKSVEGQLFTKVGPTGKIDKQDEKLALLLFAEKKLLGRRFRKKGKKYAGKTLGELQTLIGDMEKFTGQEKAKLSGEVDTMYRMKKSPELLKRVQSVRETNPRGVRELDY